jgi:hypothetical protein
MKLWKSQNKNMESGHLFAISFPGGLGKKFFNGDEKELSSLRSQLIGMMEMSRYCEPD